MGIDLLQPVNFFAVFLLLVVALAFVVVVTLESAVRLILATKLLGGVESMEKLFSLGVVGDLEYITVYDENGDLLSLGVGESNNGPGGYFVA